MNKSEFFLKLSYLRGVKIIRFITLVSLIFITFLGTIGVDVFTHSCENDGVFHSFFINQPSHCEETSGDLPTCCSAEKNAPEDAGCCSTKVKHITAKFDFNHYYSPTILLVTDSPASVTPIDVFSVATLQTEQLTAFVEPPPKSWGRQLLIQHQVFRI
jgi:hypothetical protein